MLVSLTSELTHAGPKDADREAELRRPSGVVCSDLVRPRSHLFLPSICSDKFNLVRKVCLDELAKCNVIIMEK